MHTSRDSLAYAQSTHCDACAQNYDAYVPATVATVDGLHLCDTCAGI